MLQQFTFTIDKINTLAELNTADQELIQNARNATEYAYAPYSKFLVGAAARLTNGKIVLGSNQENASYGAAICAERVLLSTLSTIYPKEKITTLAISYNNLNASSDKPISPCGICRQSLLEHEMNAKGLLRILMSGQSGEIWIVEGVKNLLPLAFSSNSMT